MKVLIACEESQEVCKAFREQGHEAYSCDIQPCSGGHPEWHIYGDCLQIINGRSSFITADGAWHDIDTTLDLIIAHPPCTDLAVSGARHFAQKQKRRTAAKVNRVLYADGTCRLRPYRR